MCREKNRRKIKFQLGLCSARIGDGIIFILICLTSAKERCIHCHPRSRTGPGSDSILMLESPFHESLMLF